MAWERKWRDLKGRVMLVRHFEAVARAAETPLKRRAAIAAEQRRIAEALGKSEEAVYAWRVGFRRPEFEDRPLLEKMTGVPVSSWRTKEERARAKRLDAA